MHRCFSSRVHLCVACTHEEAVTGIALVIDPSLARALSLAKSGRPLRRRRRRRRSRQRVWSLKKLSCHLPLLEVSARARPRTHYVFNNSAEVLLCLLTRSSVHISQEAKCKICEQGVCLAAAVCAARDVFVFSSSPACMHKVGASASLKRQSVIRLLLTFLCFNWYGTVK
jgi:hypothetical protein